MIIHLRHLFYYTSCLPIKMLFIICVGLFINCFTPLLLLAHGGHTQHDGLKFIANIGQWDGAFFYKAETRDAAYFFDNKGYAIVANLPLAHGIAASTDTPLKLKGHIIRVNFINALPMLKHEGYNKLPDVQHYYLGNEPKQWKVNVPLFEGFTRYNLYKGIDMHVQRFGNAFKSEFIVKKGSNASEIKIEYEGADYLRLIDGKLVIGTSLGEITESAPIAWQDINNVRLEVPCNFKLIGNVVSFSFPKGYDKSHALVIDPEIIFYTYTGAKSDNWGSTATYDKHGNAYSVSTVFGRQYPTTIGAFDVTYNGSGQTIYDFDVAVTKFDSTGRRIIYSSFLGGRNGEFPHSVVVDKNDNLIIFGTTSSPNFPTSINAYRRGFRGSVSVLPLTDNSVEYIAGSDIFVTKFNANGTALIGSTFINGNGIDGCIDYFESLNNNYGDGFKGEVEVDDDGFIYVASSTTSVNFPVANGFSNIKNNGRDGIVVKLNPMLTNMEWGTFIGGSGDDAVFSMEIDASRRVYVCGATTSQNFPTSVNAFQRNPLGNIDGFLAVISADGGTLLASTYIGGGGYDAAYNVALDNSNNVYVLGQTKSAMPRTNGVYGQINGGQFIQCFNNGLTALVFATTFGFTPFQPNIVPTAFMVNQCKQIYISGWGGEINRQSIGFIGGSTVGLPVTQDAFQRTTDGSDFYLMILTEGARNLRYASYLGQNGGRGEHVDGGTSRFDKQRGIVYQAVCGCLGSPDIGEGTGYPGTVGAYATSIGSNNCNAALLKFNLGEPQANFKFVAQNKCGEQILFTNTSINGLSHVWYFGNGDSLISNSKSITYSYKHPGKYLVTIKAINQFSCTVQDFFSDTVEVVSPFKFEADTTKVFICKGEVITANVPGLADLQVEWTPSRYLSDNRIPNPVISAEGSILYTIKVKNADGCEGVTYFRLINRKVNLLIIDSIKRDFCNGYVDMTFKAAGDESEFYLWESNMGDRQEGKVFKKRFKENVGTFEISLTGGKDGCGEKVYKDIPVNVQKILFKPDFDIHTYYENCTMPGIELKNLSLNGINFSWDFGDGQRVQSFEATHQYADTGKYTVKLIVENSRCFDTLSKVVHIKPFIAPNLITLNNDNKNDKLIFSNWEPGWMLEVYNRWGRLLFKTNNYQNDWQPPDREEGVYFYNVRFSNGKSCRGWVQTVK